MAAVKILAIQIFVGIAGGILLPDCRQAEPPEWGNAVERILDDGTKQTIFSCGDGRRLKGRKIATCTFDGWNVPTPECVLNEQRDVRLDLYVGDDPAILADPSSTGSKKKNPNGRKKHLELQKKRRKERRNNNKRKKSRNSNLRTKETPMSEAPVVTSPSGLNETTAARLDLSCFMKARGKNLVKAPTVKHARPAKYERSRNLLPPYNRYLVAVYQCQETFAIKVPTLNRLYCSDGNWLGTLPECINVEDQLKPLPKRCGEDRGGCDQFCQDTESGIECSCSKGFRTEGYSCLDIDECDEGKAGCEDTCRNVPGSFHCECNSSGFQLDADARSCRDINECLANNGRGPCQGSCRNFDGGYGCSCSGIAGHRLAADNHTCEDVDECAENNAGCSHTCLNTVGSVFCLCPDGFFLTDDWKTCQDINECEKDPRICEKDSLCENSPGSYRCVPAPKKVTKILQDEDYDAENYSDEDDNYDDEDEGITELPEYGRCSEGFRKTADEECVDINECEADESGQFHGCDHDCVNEPGGYHCSCRPGYAIQKDGATCRDIDECAVDPSICSHVCKNTEGSYECRCPKNYMLKEDNKTCDKIAPANTCSNLERACSHDCEDTESGPVCKCTSGYELQADKKTCEDINECLGEISPCSHICNNTDGSYACLCPPSFALKSDNRTCEKIELSCSSSFSCSHRCEETASGPVCRCPSGHRLAEDDKTCEDIDECLGEISPCSHICNNTDGSYACLCPPSFALKSDNRTCEKIELSCSSSFSCSHHCEETASGPVCRCPSGHRLAEDDKTCEDIDECLGEISPCSHICNNTDGSYACLCPPSFALKSDNRTCEKIELSCSSSFSCSHRCEETASGPVCRCPSGHRLAEDDKTCEDIDECLGEISPCSHICNNTDGSYACLCPPDHALKEDKKTCEGIARTCSNLESPCSHDCEDTVSGPVCTCEFGYELDSTGKVCSDIDECDRGACSHGCVNLEGTFLCSCPRGLHLPNNERFNCTDVDECSSGNHECEQNCTNLHAGYECSCGKGFVLLDDGKSCRDVDECESDEHDCSHDCVNTPGSYVCECPAGAKLQSDGQTCEDTECPDGLRLDENGDCQDVDECVEENHGCSQGCVNEYGTYRCTCRGGFELDERGFGCVVSNSTVDPCSVGNNGCSHTCGRDGDRTRCGCPEGFVINGEEEKICRDLDECNEGVHACSHVCKNLEGSYLCECPEGYELEDDRRNCRDVDECALKMDGCSHDCVNFDGGFWCNCPETLALDRDNKTCMDIDECALGRHNCTHGCVNIVDGYRCDCPEGYELEDDQRNCRDVDECALKMDGCSHDCTNFPGGFWCNCPETLALDRDNKTCMDIDECALGSHNCTHRCVNIVDGYRCECPDGHRRQPDGWTCEKSSLNVCPTGFVLSARDNETCDDVDECNEGNDIDKSCSHICVNTHGSYRCDCPPGYKIGEDNATCEDVNECVADNGGCSHLCANTEGGVECACPDGHRLLEDDGKTCVEIDECLIDNGGCSHGCMYDNGTVTCTCPVGFFLDENDETRCLMDDPCLDSNAGCSHFCDYSNGTVTCYCPAGMRLEEEDETHCVLENPCLENNGGCSHFCDYSNRTMTCHCPVGMRLKEDVRDCVLENPCLENNGGCSHFCDYSNRTMTCHCPVGMRLKEDVRDCVLENPCFENNGGCSHFCDYFNRTMTCHCPVGMRLKEDVRDCVLENPCFENNGGCSHFCDYSNSTMTCHCPVGMRLKEDRKVCVLESPCFENNGGCSNICDYFNGTVVCGCPMGMRLEEEDGRVCVLENPCLDNNGGCSHFCDYSDSAMTCHCPVGMRLKEDRKVCVLESSCFDNNGGCSDICDYLNGMVVCGCPVGKHLKEDGRVCVLESPCTDNNGGCSNTCRFAAGVKSCECPRGFQLSRLNNETCEDVDECSVGIHDCHRFCVNEPGSYKCDCPAGFTLNPDGVSCDDVDECLADNGGCSNDCVNVPGSFHCSCPASHVLDSANSTCISVDPCKLDNGNCSHHCSWDAIEATANCSCPAGYRLQSDRRTCVDVDECEEFENDVDSGCSHECVNLQGSYRCDCPSGFILQQEDGKTCVDLNECLSGMHNCSHDCLNLLGSYICSCYVGHYLHSDSATCLDIDECQERNGGCSHVCNNTKGGHTCSCPSGLELSRDERVCIDVDECDSGVANCSHDCLNTLGSWKCVCPDGHILGNDSRTCLRSEHCSVGNGGCSHACFNVPIGVRCSCPMGLRLGWNEKTCEDTDECLEDNGGCSHFCRNTEGSYHCECPFGHVLEDKTCRLEDPCRRDNGGCEQKCGNYNGTAVCSCEYGYRVHGTNRSSCVDIDECSGSHGCQHFCVNTVGSFECGCKLGFEARNSSCVDIDECANEGACSDGSRCINTDGGFRCACQTGYLPSGNYCIDVDECKWNNGGCSHDCRNIPGSYTCLCPRGFAPDPRNASHCQDVDECLTLKGGCTGDCVNTPGSYYCACPDNLVLASDERTCVSPRDRVGVGARCAPMEPPGHGEIRCPGHSSGALDYPQGARCYLRCRRGFKLEGAHARYCAPGGRWNGPEPSCVRETNLQDSGRRYYSGSSDAAAAPRPFVRCPADVDAELPPGGNTARIAFPQPKSNMDWWRYVDASPTWGKQLQADLPAGTAVVTFTARSPVSNYTSTCRVVIRVRDAQNPKVFACPVSFEVRLGPGERSRMIFWQEPTFTDNVRIERVWKSRDSGQLMYPGVHNVRYIASDPAGNRAECHFMIHVREPERLQDSEPRTYRRMLMCPGRAPRPIPANGYRWQIPSGCYLRYTRLFSGTYALQQRYSGAGHNRDGYQTARAAYHEIHPIHGVQHSARARTYPLVDFLTSQTKLFGCLVRRHVEARYPANDVARSGRRVSYSKPSETVKSGGMLSVEAPAKFVLTLQSVPPFLVESILALALVVLLAVPLIAHVQLLLDNVTKAPTMVAASRRRRDRDELGNHGIQTVVMHYPAPVRLDSSSNSDLNIELTSMRTTCSTPTIKRSATNFRRESTRLERPSHQDEQHMQALQEVFLQRQKTCLPLERSSSFLETNAQLPIIDISAFDYDSYRHKLIEASLKRQYGDRQAPGNVVLNSIHLNSISSQSGIQLSEKYSHSLFEFIEEYYDATRSMSKRETEYLHPLDHFLVKGIARPKTAERGTETKESMTELDHVPELVDFRDQSPIPAAPGSPAFGRRRFLEESKHASKLTIRSRGSSSIPRTSSQTRPGSATSERNSSNTTTRQLLERSENVNENRPSSAFAAEERRKNSPLPRVSRSRTPRSESTTNSRPVKRISGGSEAARRRASSLVRGRSSNESVGPGPARPGEHSEALSTDRDEKESVTCASASSSEAGSSHSCSSRPREKRHARSRGSSLSSRSRTIRTPSQTRQWYVGGNPNASFNRNYLETQRESLVKPAKPKLSLRPRSTGGSFAWDVPDVPGRNWCAETAGPPDEERPPVVPERPRTANPPLNRRRTPEKGKISDTVLPVLESVVDLRVELDQFDVADETDRQNAPRTPSPTIRELKRPARSRDKKIASESFVKSTTVRHTTEVHRTNTSPVGKSAEKAKPQEVPVDVGKSSSATKTPANRPGSVSRLPVHVGVDKAKMRKLMQETSRTIRAPEGVKLLENSPRAERNSSVFGRAKRPRTAGSLQGANASSLSPKIERSLETLQPDGLETPVNEVVQKVTSYADHPKTPSRSPSLGTKRTPRSRTSVEKTAKPPTPRISQDETNSSGKNAQPDDNVKRPFLRARSGQHGAPKLSRVENRPKNSTTPRRTPGDDEDANELARLPTEGSRAALVMQRELKTYIKRIKLVLSNGDKSVQAKELASLSITEAIIPELRALLSPREIEELQGLLDRAEKK